jgi:pyridoxal biosynthesis lyase PdxS
MGTFALYPYMFCYMSDQKTGGTMERESINKNIAQMLKGEVIMDVVNKEEAIIAEIR